MAGIIVQIEVVSFAVFATCGGGASAVDKPGGDARPWTGSPAPRGVPRLVGSCRRAAVPRELGLQPRAWPPSREEPVDLAAGGWRDGEPAAARLLQIGRFPGAGGRPGHGGRLDGVPDRPAAGDFVPRVPADRPSERRPRRRRSRARLPRPPLVRLLPAPDRRPDHPSPGDAAPVRPADERPRRAGSGLGRRDAVPGRPAQEGRHRRPFRRLHASAVRARSQRAGTSARGGLGRHAVACAAGLLRRPGSHRHGDRPEAPVRHQPAAELQQPV